MVYFLLSVGCAPFSSSTTDAAPFPADIIAVDPAAEEEADSPELTPVASRSSSLTLTLPAEGADFYELRPYRLDGETPWIGRALVLAEITAETTTLEFPRVAPRRDRAPAGDGSVVYAITLRVADGNGDPGAYTGIAKDRLVYIHRDAPEGASIGWNLARDYDAEVEWTVMADGLELVENLRGDDTLTLNGRSTVEIGMGTHLELIGEGASAFDLPIGPDWSLSLPGAPPSEALTEEEPVAGAVLSLYAYDDVGADNRRTDELTVGQACLGYQAALVTWFDSPYDLVDTLALEASGSHSGWGLAVETEQGRVNVPSDVSEALMINETCDEPS